MRDLTVQECLQVAGAGGESGTLTVSAETMGSAVGGYIGGMVGGGPGALGGTIMGGAIGNYLKGNRVPGSMGPSGFPWGGKNGGGVLWGEDGGA